MTVVCGLRTRLGVALLALVVALFIAWPAAASISDGGFYLSYEQRLAISVSVELLTATPEERLHLAESAGNWASIHSSLPEKTVTITSFNEFLEAWKGPWPDTHSLTLDVQKALAEPPLGPRRFVAKDKALQNQIDAYINSQLQKIPGLLHQNGIDAQLLLSADLSLQKLDFAAFKEQGKKLLDSQLARIDQMSTQLTDQAFSGSDDKAMKIAMKTMFSGYYSRLGVDSKKAILSAILGSNLAMDNLGRFSILLQNSGPQLQKMIQIIARQSGLNAAVAAIFQRLESEVKPVPPALMREIIANDGGGFDFVSVDEKPLGVGTMAQVHRAVLRRGKRLVNVVVRFLKPGIESRVDEDHRILIQVAAELDANPEFKATGAPKLSPLIEEISNTVRAELDIQATIRRQVEAADVYRRSFRTRDPGASALIINFQVPGVFKASAPSKLHVQELVAGRKLESVAEEFGGVYPNLRRTVAEQTAKMWIATVLFGPGFYHSDLHQGNLLAKMRESEIDVTLLDYGMAGRLSKSMQEKAIALAVAAEARDNEALIRLFWELSTKSKNKTKFPRFEEASLREAQNLEGDRLPPKDLREWTVFAIDHGLALPYDFININRGSVILENSLRQSGSSKTFASIATELALAHPVHMGRVLLAQGLSPKSLIKLGFSTVLSTTGLRSTLPTATSHAVGTLRCEAVFR